jgi:MFS family permease
MSSEEDHVQISKLEKTLMVGIVACMLFATWELGHLMVYRWLKTWVDQNDFVDARIIYYGIAFFMAIIAVITTSSFSMRFGRFGNTINRAFLWYGTLLLISTIAIFVFDCLPEVVAGFIGAAIFIAAIFVLQKRYFTKERVIRIRLSKGKCPKCAADLQPNSLF